MLFVFKFVFKFFRFIDDIFAIWTHGTETLKTFLTYMNNAHATIKFDYEYSLTSVNFLDTTIYINNNNNLESQLYIKPTDKTLLLHNTSFHPDACKRGIIYSQTLRYRRLITDDTKLNTQLQKLKIILISRGYNNRIIDEAITSATTYTQQQLLTDSL